MLHQIAAFLPIAERILNRRHPDPLLQSICIENSWMRMSDGEFFARMPLEEDRYYTLPVELLKRVLKTRPNSLKVELLEKNLIRLHFGNQHITFTAEDARNYPDIPNENFRAMGTWSKAAILQLHRQLPFTAKHSPESFQNGVYIHQNKRLRSCATDGHILQYVDDLDPVNACRFQKDFLGILPRKGIQLLCKFAKGNVKVAAGKTLLRYTLPGKVELYIPPLKDAYPDFLKIVNRELPHEIRLKKETLLNVMKAVSPLKADVMLFNMKNGRIEIRAENRDTDVSFETEILTLERRGKALQIGFDPKLLETTLKAIEGDEVIWQYSAAHAQSKFSGAGNNVNIIMPIQGVGKT